MAGSDPGEMLREYDFSTMGPPVQGKYVDAYRRHVRMIQLTDDITDVYPDEESVLSALRIFAKEHPDLVSG